MSMLAMDRDQLRIAAFRKGRRLRTKNKKGKTLWPNPYVTYMRPNPRLYQHRLCCIQISRRHSSCWRAARATNHDGLKPSGPPRLAAPPTRRGPLDHVEKCPLNPRNVPRSKSTRSKGRMTHTRITATTGTHPIAGANHHESRYHCIARTPAASPSP